MILVGESCWCVFVFLQFKMLEKEITTERLQFISEYRKRRLLRSHSRFTIKRGHRSLLRKYFLWLHGFCCKNGHLKHHKLMLDYFVIQLQYNYILQVVGVQCLMVPTVCLAYLCLGHRMGLSSFFKSLYCQCPCSA